ncbi:unnamed protein product [Ambrosiozyma monospora]|uniref:Unnamed protein product n=1 Tax=Ambrosiozyma monospora TaxID=43982 RepID=A0ACB5TYF5_AMBMO|nr:unnamed protein product [Ambrosiozyma monospora]
MLSLNCKSFLLRDEHKAAVFDKVCKRVLDESQRRNKKYVKLSVKSLGKFLGVYGYVLDDGDVYYDSYLETVEKLMFGKPKQATDEDAMDTDSDDDEDDGNAQYSKRVKLEQAESYRNSLLENLILSLNKDEPEPKIINYLNNSISRIFDAKSSEPNSSTEELTYRTKLVGLNITTQEINKLIVKSSSQANEKDHDGDVNIDDDDEKFTTNLPNNKQTVEILATIFQNYQTISKQCIAKDNLQNVLVSTIRLTKLIVLKLLPVLKELKEEASEDKKRMKYCVDLLNGVKVDKVNSVVVKEAEIALDEILN